MVKAEYRMLLKEGAMAWNKWRRERSQNLKETKEKWWRHESLDLNGIDLRGFDLSGVNLFEADLTRSELSRTNLANANLSGAKLIQATLCEANLSKADLRDADLWGANLIEANLDQAILSNAKLITADLDGASLIEADLHGADFGAASLLNANCTSANFSYADLSLACLVKANLRGAMLIGCNVYGVSAWDVNLEEAVQSGLIIKHGRTRTGRGLGMFDKRSFPKRFVVTVDNLKIAQFIYTLMSNPEVHDMIDSIASKVVLILGRFTPERKPVLDALRENLGERNYTPILCDFEGPVSRDITETVTTLAHLARFIIADITEARSVPQELMAIVPFLPSVPVQPLLQDSTKEYGMFEHFRRYPWVLPIYRYGDVEDLVASLSKDIIEPAEAKVLEQRKVPA
jgi:uncharacterized protein YjbI with pentapeptide repeats